MAQWMVTGTLVTLAPAEDFGTFTPPQRHRVGFGWGCDGDLVGFVTRRELMEDTIWARWGWSYDNNSLQVKVFENVFSCPKIRGLGNKTGSLYSRRGEEVWRNGEPVKVHSHFLALALLAALVLTNSLGVLYNSRVIWI